MLPLYLFLLFAPADASRPHERLPLPTAEVNDLSGVWWCEGAFSGKAYVGAVLVTRHGSLYRLQYTVTDGIPYDGFGLLRDNVLSVTWTQGKMQGVASYRVQSASRLEGRYVYYGEGRTDGKTYRENLTLLRRLPGE